MASPSLCKRRYRGYTTFSQFTRNRQVSRGVKNFTAVYL
jgi:hypothetical protein